MPKRLTLDLDPQEEHELERVRDTHEKPHMREKAAALLKIADGQSARAVALNGLLRERRPQTVARWHHRYRQAGLEGLQVQEGRGRKPAFSPDAESQGP